jgi:4-hydroxybenzoate polyprenyltransferase
MKHRPISRRRAWFYIILGALLFVGVIVEIGREEISFIGTIFWALVASCLMIVGIDELKRRRDRRNGFTDHEEEDVEWL